MTRANYRVKAEVHWTSPAKFLSAGVLKVAGLVSSPFDHRGVYQVGRALRGYLDGATGIVVSGEQVCFRFPLSDPYWSRLLAWLFRYETEMWALLRLAGQSGAAFIDAGANRGLWSAVAVQEGLAPVVAIEPGRQAGRWLEETRELNGGRFEIVTAAVTDRDSGFGTFIDSADEAKAGSGLSDSNQDGAYSVELRTVDSIAAQYLSDGVQNLAIVKLDVEGAEIPAIVGCFGLLRAGSVLMVEDHGKDSTCAVTDFLLNQGLRVAIFRKGLFAEIYDASHLAKMKTRKSKGYNVLAGTVESALFTRLCQANLRTILS